MKHKVVLNTAGRRLRLNETAVRRLLEFGVPSTSMGCPTPLPYGMIFEDQLPRHDTRLVQLIEEMGTSAGAMGDKPEIMEISESSYVVEFSEDDSQEYVVTPGSYDWVHIDESDESKG